MATSVWSESKPLWYPVGSSKDDIIYIDFLNMKTNASLVFVWVLTDFKKLDSRGHLSTKGLYEVDCEMPEKYKLLSLNFYKSSMGEGELSDNWTPTNEEYQYPLPNSVISAVVSNTCELAK